MKRIICAVLAVGLFATGPLAGRARAEDGDRAHHMGKMLKERIGLSDDQAAKLKAAWEAQKAAVKPLREQAKESRRKLEEQVRDLASENDIRATLDQIEANRKAMMAEHQKLQATLASVLRPSQRAKMSLMMAHMKGRHKSGGARGGRGHDGDQHRDDD